VFISRETATWAFGDAGDPSARRGVGRPALEFAGSSSRMQFFAIKDALKRSFRDGF